MNMNKVNEILKKHDSVLDAMTDEEREAYYANAGLSMNKTTIKEEQHVGINNIEKVKNRLKNGEITIDKYQYSVQHNPDCIKAAIQGNIINYDYISEEFKAKKWVGNVYYSRLIQDQEIEEEKAKIYEDYYPWELVIEKALKEDTVNSPVDIIKNVVDDMTDEELIDLKNRVGNLAKAFIDPNMNDSIASMQDNYIISGHKEKIDVEGVRHY